jgi:anti-sigma-K factor RskA
MNVSEYIASGIVELYAMNALSPEEKKEFERLMILYPEIKEELKKTELALEDYAMSHSINPRPRLRELIMEEVKENNKEIKIVPRKKVNQENYFLTYKYMIAASLAALVVSTFASWFFYTRWNEAEERYSSLLNEKNELAQNYNIVKANYDESVSNLVVIRDESSNVIVLSSTDSTHHYQARVYWSKYTHRSFLDVLSLPSPGDGKQYQLWALVGGKPVDAGVFMTGAQSIQRMKDILQAEVWAVTLEPKGGSVSPTLSQMYLISKSG